jgi:DNA helicase II / ATP-dependent DNA helicase PcrA
MIPIDELISQLNAEQRQAVMINEGSLLVFAGAGSGKTRVITTKIAYAIEKLGLEPWQILAVTFTNRACKEMQERVSSFVGEEKGNQVMIKTFHSFGVWLLRKYGTRVGLNENFKIYDDDDSVTLLTQEFANSNVEVSRKVLTEYYKKISILKDKMQRPDKLDERLLRCYNKYQNALARTGNVDFADMIIKSIELLQKDSEVKKHVHNRFKMILVDEYQDSNTAQFLLLKELVGPKTFVCAVGDDDQSIYRFRGAEIQNILDFANQFPNTQKVVLGKNYRCTQNILSAANDVITKNNTRVKKDLSAANQGGQKPQLIYVNSGRDEAEKVVEILKKAAVKDPRAYNNSAVLYRTNAQSKDFEDRFMINKISYHLVGSLRFYDREEVRDCIALLSLLSNPKDSVAFQRMVNKPARKVGDTSIAKILEYSQNSLMADGNLIQSAQNALEEGLIRGGAVGGLNEFLKAYFDCQMQFGTISNGDLLEKMLTDFGILNYYRKRDTDEHNDENKRTDNLDQLVSMLSLSEFSNGQEGINAFLEFAALDPSSLDNAEGKKEDGVTLITMHNTKGLEYDRVFMVGMEDEIFPGDREDRTEADIEEERRICYVAMTRARKELYMITAASRMRWGNLQRNSPSRFLKEISPEHVEVIQTQGSRDIGFGGYGGYGSWGGYSSHAADWDDWQESPRHNYSKSYSNSYSKPEPAKSAGPKPSEAGKYNIRNMAKGVLIKKANKVQLPAKPVEFAVNDRIRSDFYGDGTIVNLRTSAGREVYDVKFDNGRTGTFSKDKVSFVKI